MSLNQFPYTRGNPDGIIAIVGEAPGADEQYAFSMGQRSSAFVGVSGRELDREIKSVGISLKECYFTNVIKQKPTHNNVRTIPRSVIEQCIVSLREELASLPNLTVIVPVGNLALYATAQLPTVKWDGDFIKTDKKNPNKGGLEGITKYRGSIYETSLKNHKVKTIPTFHPAHVLRNWETRTTVLTDWKRISEDRHFSELRLPDPLLWISPTFQETISFIKEAHNSPQIATDIENRTVKRLARASEVSMRTQIFCIGIAISADEAMCIPMEWPDGTRYWTVEEEAKILLALHSLLSTHKGQIGQFYYHDAYYYHHYGLIEALKTPFKNCRFDTYQAHMCGYAELPHSLDYLASIYTRHPYYKDEGREWTSDMAVEQFWRYNSLDCVTTFGTAEVLEPDIEELGLTEFFHTQYTNLFPYLLQSMVRGINVDYVVRNKARDEYTHKWAGIQDDLQQLVNRPINLPENHKLWPKTEGYLNVNSQKQISAYFDLKNIKHTTTGEDELKELRGRLIAKKQDREAKVVNKILEVRKVRKVLSTYLNIVLGHDNRFHFTLKTGTETGRLSSSTDPFKLGGNSQNIPDGVCRELLIADPGKVLIYADLEQAEARAVAYISGCVRMIREFEDADKLESCHCNSGLLFKHCCGDVHKLTASEIYQIPTSQISNDSKERAMGKKIKHASNYMMGAVTMSKDTGLPVFICRSLIEKYFSRYHEVRDDWHAELEHIAKTTHMIRNPFGRVRFFLGRPSEQKTIREMVAHEPQSIVPDIINQAYQVIAEHDNPRIEVLTQVHDALLVQVAINEVSKACTFMKEALEIPFYAKNRRVIIPVDFKVGYCWSSEKMMKLSTWKAQRTA